jgi:hypothetical protein
MISAGSESGAKRFAAKVSALLPSTLYHARVVATNATGTSEGEDFTFTTAARPVTPPATETAKPEPSSTKPVTEPVPAAAVEPPAVPVVGKALGVAVVTGEVRVKLAGERNFSAVPAGGVLPTGSVIDATKGVAQLVTALPGGGTQVATLWRGAVTIRQQASGMTDLYLYGAMRGCSSRAGRNARVAAKKKPGAKKRLIWVKDNSGRFRSHGRNSVATVRGTKWLTRDTCKGTLTKVVEGKVAVKDRRTHRTVVVRAGRSYFARSRA